MNSASLTPEMDPNGPHLTLTVLGSGTSTGVPVPGCPCEICNSGDPKNMRLRTSALISKEGGPHILIDTSADFRQQALLYKIPRVDSVLYTHYHSDHILGLEDLRGYNYLQKESIPCYGTDNTLAEIRRCFSYIFNPDPRYVGGQVPQVVLNEISDATPFEVLGLKVRPFPILHGMAYVTGFRLGELAYATDCKVLPEYSMEVVRGVKYLILDGLRYEPHKAHLTIPEAIELAQIIGAEKTYLIHMTHTVDYHKVSKDLPKGIELAYDGMKIDFVGEYAFAATEI